MNSQFIQPKGKLSMRGFRSSRSAKNEITSRFGRAQSPHLRAIDAVSGNSNDVHVGNVRPVLPDWLKTPETRENEKQLAASAPPAEQTLLSQKPHAKPQLRLVVNNGPVERKASSEKKVVKKVSAKSPKPAPGKSASARKSRAAKPRVRRKAA